MTEEEKAAQAAEAEAQAQATAEKEAEEAEFEASIADLPDEEKEAKRAERQGSSPNNAIDYNAELARLQEGKKKAEEAAAKERFKKSEALRKAKEIETITPEDDEDDDSRPLTRAELIKELAERDKNQQKLLLQARAEELAGRLASSPAEKALIMEHWKSVTFPPNYTLEDQIEGAYAFANAKRLTGERNEALRALKNKDTVSTNGAGTHFNRPSKEPAIPSDKKSVLVKNGFKHNPATGRFEKRLPDGRVLINDPKTGRIFPEDHILPKAGS